MSQTIRRLLLVYNADSGAFAAIVDSAKKLLMLNGCPLCSLTHALTGERREWRSCKESFGVPVEYLHRDELAPRMREVVRDQLPSVVADTGDGLVVLLGPEAIGRCRGDVADLKGRILTHAAMRKLQLPASVGA